MLNASRPWPAALRAALSLVCAVAALPAAAADQVEITGRITQVGVSQSFTVGEAYSFRFDWVGPGPETLPGSGNYMAAGGSALFRVAGYEIGGPVVSYALRNNPAGSFDRVGIASATYLSASSPATPLTYPFLIDGRQPFSVGLEMTDNSGTALSSTMLTDPTFDVGRFDTRTFEIAFAREVYAYGAVDVVRVFGTVDTMSVISSPVPEPTAVALGLAGLSVLGLAGARRRRATSASQETST
jgi:MYXO-CTERM domain-containing protein